MQFRLIALALAALASPVFAATTASITTGSFNAAIKDLNAADGVTSAITWDSNWALSSSSSFVQQTGYAMAPSGNGFYLDPTYGSDAFQYTSAPAGSTSLSGNTAGGIGSYSISLDGSGGVAMSLQLAIAEGATGGASAQFSRGFWLTSGTQVSFSLLADRYLTGSAYTGGWTVPGNVYGIPGHSYANGSVRMAVGNVFSTGTSYGYNNFVDGETGDYEVLGEADQFKLIIRNTTAAAQYYTLSVSAGVNLSEMLDPATAAMVPEPSSYALMALGLAGVGVAVRRRRRG